MRYLFSIVLTPLLFFAPVLAEAQLVSAGNAGRMQELIVTLLRITNDLLIPGILAIGFLVFVWGVFLHFIVGGADEEKRAQGRSYIVYATLGFVIIIIFFGVVNLITSSIGLEGQTLDFVPSTPIFGP